MAAVQEVLSLPDHIAEQQDDVWARIARSYAAFGSPFVPCSEDIAAFERAATLQANLCGAQGLRAVMLGVTPAVALMKWPRGTRILGVEISRAVIEALWPGDVTGVREAVCASWFGIPVARRSCNLIVGDGSLIACRFPGEVRSLIRACHDLLADNGMLALRCYVRPPENETVSEVFDALFGMGGLSVDCFKMRLYLAMQRSAEEGVSVRDAARLLEKHHLSSRVMKERLGWSGGAIEPFSAWRASDAVYSFPTLDELRRVVGECFDEVSITSPGYELGHCCPTLLMRSKAIRKRT